MLDDIRVRKHTADYHRWLSYLDRNHGLLMRYIIVDAKLVELRSPDRHLVSLNTGLRNVENTGLAAFLTGLNCSPDQKTKTGRNEEHNDLAASKKGK